MTAVGSRSRKGGDTWGTRQQPQLFATGMRKSRQVRRASYGVRTQAILSKTRASGVLASKALKRSAPKERMSD
jgi:hypothetical protein